MDPAAMASAYMVKVAPAVMGGDGQWPAVMDLGWWSVEAVAEMAAQRRRREDGGGGGSDDGGGCGGGGNAVARPRCQDGLALLSGV